MVVARQIQTNFSSGEISPLMSFRSDTGAFQNGAATLRNVSLLNTGGVTRRPGTELINSIGGTKARLVPFEFDENEKYIVAFRAGFVGFYKPDGTSLGVLLWSGLLESYIYEITYAQAGDTMIVCHPLLRPRVIRRIGATSFTLSLFEFDEGLSDKIVYQPYAKYAPADVFILTSGSTTAGSTVTVTSNAAVFSPYHVGTRIRKNGSEILITGYISSTQVTGRVKKDFTAKYDNNPFRSTAGSAVIEVTHVGHNIPNGANIEISGADDVGGVTGLNGFRGVTVIDENTYKILGTTTATASVDGGGPSVKYTGNYPTYNWDEQVFSDVTGWPSAVCFHEGRLWFGGTLSQPDGLFSSQINSYFNFSVGDGLDNESIQISIASSNISKIQHIVSNRDLQVFTATGEFVAPKNTNVGLTPSNMRVLPQTPYGSNKVAPIPFDGGTLFVQNSQTAVREFIYADNENGYASTNLNVLAGHILKNPTDMAVLYGSTTRNEQYAFVVNGDDGSLAIFHSARSEGIAGWTRWDLPNGEIQSVCSVGNAIYASVLYNSFNFLVRFSPDDSVYLDLARDYTVIAGSPNVLVSNFYANTEVDVIADGYYLGKYSVNSSNYLIGLPVSDDARDITIGYAFDLEIKTLPLNLTLPNGSTTGLPKRLNRVFVGLNSTLNAVVNGNQMILRTVNEDISVGESPVTEVREFYLLGYNREPFVSITQSAPVPIRVLGMNMELGF